MPEHFKLWQRQANKDYSSTLKELDGIKKLDLSKNTLICIPGYSSTHKNGREVNGYMGVAQEMLGGREIDVNLIAISYPSTEGEKIHVDGFNNDPQHYASSGAREFARNILIPMLKSGKDVNVLAKSYGSVFFKMVMNEVREKNIRYDPSHLRVLATGNIARLNYDLPHEATEVYVEGTNDSKAARLMNTYKEPAPAGHKDLTMIPLTDSVLHVYADVPNEVLLWDARPAKQGKDGDPDEPAKLELVKLHDPECHTTRMFTTLDPNHSVAHLLRRVLRNMMTLKGKDYTLASAMDYRAPLIKPRHSVEQRNSFQTGMFMHLNKAQERGEESRNVKAVLFDWDLTLANGEEVNRMSLNATFKAMDDILAKKGFEKLNLPEWDLEDTRLKFVGTVPSFFGGMYQKYGDDVVEQAKALFRKLRAEHRSLTVLMPGAKEILQQLQAKGIKIAIVSNKDEFELLEQKKLLLPGIKFDSIVGNEAGVKGKPSPEQLLSAFKDMDILPEKAASVLMVGDQMKSDIDAALAAGCKPCLIGDKVGFEALWKESRHFLDTAPFDHHVVVQHKAGNPVLFVENLDALGKYFDTPRMQKASGFAL